MKRKLIKQGSNSYTLTIPKKWLKSLDLTTVPEISIEEHEDTLILSKENNEKTKLKKKFIEIHLHEEDRELKIQLGEAYRLGYDIIKINYKTEEYKNKVVELCEDLLLGFEVVEENEKYIQIESVTEPDISKRDIIVRKIFLYIKENYTLIKKFFETGEKEFIFKIEKNTSKILQYINFCKRVLNKEPETLIEREIYIWAIYNNLKLLASSQLYVIQKMSKNNNINPSLSLYINKIQELTINVQEYYFLDKKELIQKLRKDSHAISDEFFFELEKNKEALFFHYMQEQVRLLQGIMIHKSELSLLE